MTRSLTPARDREPVCGQAPSSLTCGETTFTFLPSRTGQRAEDGQGARSSTANLASSAKFNRLRSMRTLALILAVLAYSQNPAPSTRKVSQNQKPDTDSSAHDAASKPHGTLQSPLFVQSVNTQKETDAEPSDRDEKTANDRKLVESPGRPVP